MGVNVTTATAPTNRTVRLPLRVEEADTFVTRFLGLMFRKSLPHDAFLHIAPCNSIHMFFMRFPIDVVFISKENIIVSVNRSVRPWHIVWPVHGAHSVLEMAVGSIDRFGLQIGDAVAWERGSN